ncbi:hypothetical protein [Clostridium tarantellae]|uniref:Uncharacterized protein n=1 Tax=Clostridium tarantellae TaxID=39493 RepID=A0A6I1MIG7_9CLOT|nr:hypothetical protein [Clostridium tarantellae]MPQ43165.1 hypothetical protein [Clostridium tarantellae]
MKKILYIFSILMVCVFFIGASSPIDIMQKELNEQLECFKSSLEEEYKSLTEKITNENDEIIKSELLNKIKVNLFMSKLSWKVEDFQQSGNNYKFIVKVNNQCNLKTLFTCNSRLKVLEEEYFEKEQELPVMSKIDYLKETIDLNKDKANNFEIEMYATISNGKAVVDSTDFYSLIKLKNLKSFFF